MTIEAYYRKDGLFVVVTDDRIFAFTKTKYLKNLSRRLEQMINENPGAVVSLLSTMTFVKKEFFLFRIFSLLSNLL